ncbi:hypothetical protein KUTeg_021618, partial [Tegillarca granosa]
ASAGIGEGIAIHFAKLGSKLCITGRNKDKLQNVVEQCVTAGLHVEKIVSVDGDITKAEDRERILNTVIKTFGKLDVLAALPYIKSSKGNIVNISSICGPKAMEGVAVYCMSKAAMDMYTECLALEMAKYGVRVNAVNPGTIVSEIARRDHTPFKADEDYQKFLDIQKTRHPLGRVGVPEDVANAVAFLASDQASFISGQILFVDGARHCVSVPVATSVDKK